MKERNPGKILTLLLSNICGNSNATLDSLRMEGKSLYQINYNQLLLESLHQRVGIYI
jgi:hypothetical protein